MTQPDDPKTPQNARPVPNRTSPRAHHDTPVVYTANGGRYGLPTQRAPDRYKRLGKEMKKWCIGPMPPTQFIDAFLPAGSNGDKGMPSPENAFKDVPFAVENRIRERGGKYEKAAENFGVKVCVDGKLYTGQNPASAKALGDAIAKALKA